MPRVSTFPEAAERQTLPTDPSIDSPTNELISSLSVPEEGGGGGE